MFFPVAFYQPMSGAGAAVALAPLRKLREAKERTVAARFPADVLISSQPALIVFEAIPQDPARIDSARLCTHSTLYQPCDPFRKSTHTSDMRACMSEEGAFSSLPPHPHKKKNKKHLSKHQMRLLT